MLIQVISKTIYKYTIGGERAAEYDRELMEFGGKLISDGFEVEFLSVFRKVICEVVKDRLDGNLCKDIGPPKLTISERKVTLSIWKKMADHVIMKLKIGLQETEL